MLEPVISFRKVRLSDQTACSRIRVFLMGFCELNMPVQLVLGVVYSGLRDGQCTEPRTKMPWGLDRWLLGVIIASSSPPNITMGLSYPHGAPATGRCSLRHPFQDLANRHSQHQVRIRGNCVRDLAQEMQHFDLEVCARSIRILVRILNIDALCHAGAKLGYVVGLICRVRGLVILICDDQGPEWRPRVRGTRRARGYLSDLSDTQWQPRRSGIPSSLKTALEIRMARDPEKSRSIRTAQT